MAVLSGVNAEPDPVVEGHEVEVRYDGEGPLYSSVDGGPWQEVPLDGEGMARMEAPVGASVIVFSDRRVPAPAETSVVILSTGV